MERSTVVQPHRLASLLQLRYPSAMQTQHALKYTSVERNLLKRGMSGSGAERSWIGAVPNFCLFLGV